MGGGSTAQLLAYLLPDPSALDSMPNVPKKISVGKLLMLLRLINGNGKRKVDGDLKMLIQPH